MDSLRDLSQKTIGLYVKNKVNVEKIERKLYESIGEAKEDFYRWCLYQLIGLIIDSGPNTAFSSLKKGEIGWNATQYKDISQKLDEIDDYLINPFEVSEGINECKCGSKKTWSFTKQTRSADEPATTFCKCVMCGTSWSYSG